MGLFTSCSRKSKKVNILKPSELRRDSERDDVTAVARIQTWWALVSQAMDFDICLFLFFSLRHTECNWRMFSEVSNLAFKKDYMQVRKQKLELGMEQMDWFQIGKGVHQGCILSPLLI